MIWIGIGGAVGAVTRYQLGIWLKSSFSSIFPIGTLFVNVTGSFILGVLTALHIDGQLHEMLWYILGVGFCGAYTTFSTFGYETVQMLQDKKLARALIYVVSSVIISFIFAWLGYSIV